MGTCAHKIAKQHLIKLLTKKALKSSAVFYVAAAAYTKQGNLLGIVSNGRKPYIPKRRGAGLHAEQRLIKRYGKNIDTIYILRCGGQGDQLPIEACENCSKIAAKLGIKIIPLNVELNCTPAEMVV